MDYLQDTSANYPSSPPLSIKEIADRAVSFDYNPLIPLRYWFRTADTLLKESSIYYSEGNEQQAYLLLMRYVQLVLQCLPTHPSASTRENARMLRQVKSRAEDALRQLENLKPRIEARYDAYIAAMRAKEMQRRTSSSLSTSSHPSSYSQHRSRRTSVPKPLDLTRGRRGSASSQTGPFSPPLERSLTPLSAKTNEDRRALAYEIAQQEFEKREREKRERRRKQAAEQGRSIPVDSTGREIRRVGTPRLGSDSYRSPRQSWARQPMESDAERQRRELEEQEDLTRSIEALGMGPGMSPNQMQQPPISDNIRYSLSELDYDFGFPPEPVQTPPETHTGKWEGSYPTIPKRSAPPAAIPSLPSLPTPKNELRAPVPVPPPKNPILVGQTPLLPAKTPLVPEALPTPPPASPPKPAKEKEFSTPATLENGTPLRTLFLPHRLREQFLAMAGPNTRRNLETCGILCGTLMRNALFVSRLVIPEQKATSDTCQTEDEEGLFEYCDREDLMVLGWIHTHPTQTCFMSSVDLHTHCSYQLMLPESIAIVCAPSQEPSWGVFRLTDPPGVKTIMNCRQQGLFHPHGESNVYTDAMRPGHVWELKDMGFDVVDLRK